MSRENVKLWCLIRHRPESSAAREKINIVFVVVLLLVFYILHV